MRSLYLSALKSIIIFVLVLLGGGFLKTSFVYAGSDDECWGCLDNFTTKELREGYCNRPSNCKEKSCCQDWINPDRMCKTTIYNKCNGNDGAHEQYFSQKLPWREKEAGRMAYNDCWNTYGISPVPRVYGEGEGTNPCNLCLNIGAGSIFPCSTKKRCIDTNVCVIKPNEHVQRPQDPGAPGEAPTPTSQAVQQSPNNPTSSSKRGDPYKGFGIFKIDTCPGSNIDDPGKEDLVCVVNKATSILMAITGAIVVVMIIISGIGYMTSMGNPTQTAWAKKSLVGSIIGLIIVVMAYSIVKLLTILLG